MTEDRTRRQRAARSLAIGKELKRVFGRSDAEPPAELLRLAEELDLRLGRVLAAQGQTASSRTALRRG